MRHIGNMADYRLISYITVDTRIHPNGDLTPMCLWWDHKPYHISRVVHVGPGCSVKAGRNCTVYDCLIHGKRKLLFWDGKAWFIERNT